MQNYFMPMVNVKLATDQNCCTQNSCKVELLNYFKIVVNETAKIQIFIL